MPKLQTTLPTHYREQDGVLRVLHEEEAIVWLWAWPSLFHWPRPVEWLFSPVTGKDHWPGDLWGVDSSGELIIIENKRGFGYDPFEDFIDYHKPERTEWLAENLLKKWQRHYKGEISFRDTFIERGSSTDGILPRSNKRVPIRRWPQLAARIDARIRAPSYRTRISRFLSTRRKRDNPRPHYCGLVVALDSRRPFLSDRGRRSMQKIWEIADGNHVHLFVSRARLLRGNRRQPVEVSFFRADR